MRIAFIQASDPLNADFTPPIWPSYLKAYAEQYVNADWCIAYDADDIIRIKPDVLAIGSMSQDWNYVQSLIDAGHDVGARVIVGGHHVTGTNWARADVASIHGPGERQFAVLLGSSPPELTSLDDLPMPDHAFGLKQGQKPALITSRGCAFNCSFCSPKLMWKKIQFHSPRRVVDEIKLIRKQFPWLRRLSIWDDLFAADQRRIYDIVKLLEDENVKWKFNSGMRASLVTKENCTLWKRMGLTRLGIGGETGSDRILKLLKGPSASVVCNQNALDLMHEAGFASGTGIIFGTPTETEEDIIATYQWLLQNYRARKLMAHEVNILTPLPGTPVWQAAVINKKVPFTYNAFNWDRLKYQAMGFRTEGRYKGRQGWMQLRRDNDSVYLNDVVPQETLFQMIEYFESEIAWCSPAQIYRRMRGTAEKVYRTMQGRLR